MKINSGKLLLSAIVLLSPVILWNTVFLNYINQHGKLVPWVLTAPIAFLSTGIFQGFAGAKKPPIVKANINPFWGWFLVALVIESFITALSNT